MWKLEEVDRVKVSEYFEQKEKFEKMIEEFFKYLCKKEENKLSAKKYCVII